MNTGFIIPRLKVSARASNPRHPHAGLESPIAALRYMLMAQPARARHTARRSWQDRDMNSDDSDPIGLLHQLLSELESLARRTAGHAGDGGADLIYRLPSTLSA